MNVCLPGYALLSIAHWTVEVLGQGTPATGGDGSRLETQKLGAESALIYKVYAAGLLGPASEAPGDGPRRLLALLIKSQ